MSTNPVITSTGAVCGAGTAVDTIWEALVSGETAVGPYRQWDGENWPVKVAAEVTESNRELVPNRKLHKSISRTDLLGICAANSALDASGLAPHRESLGEDEAVRFADRSGLVSGSGGGNYRSNYDFLPLIAESEDMAAFGRDLGSMVTPMWLLRNLPNNVLCHVGIQHQLKGWNACVTNQCLSGVQAVSEAAEALRQDEADRVLAVGHDAPFEPENLLYYHSVGLMSTRAPRPFDAGRDGTIFGEGAAAVLLEKESEARARGATVLGEYLGSGCVSEAHGILPLREDGDGVARAIKQALDNAGIAAADVGLICAHGNGTPASDLSEARGIQRVFGGAIPPVTGFKWCVGHLIAASGILDLVLALEALRRGTVPGVATLEQVDPSLDGFPVARESREPAGDIALVICRGFGGMNQAILVRGR